MAVTIDGTSGINTPGVVNTAAETIATTLAVTGVTTFAAGTAALPAITTTGDTNTGIFFPAADTIGFAEGGAEVMRIDSSGNLLVGQTTAAVETGSIVTAKNLEITRTIDSDGGALGQLSWVNNTNAGVASGTSFAKDVACIKGLMDGTGNNSGGYLTFETKADAGTRAERMRIDSSGNVGIGTSSPNYLATLFKASLPILQLANSTSGSTSADGLLIYLNGANATISNEESGSLIFQTSGTERARIASDGAFLIGKTTTDDTTEGFAYRASKYLSIVRDGAPSLILNRITDNGTVLEFRRSGTQVGGVNVTTTATTYATSSDYRLKETIIPMTGALAKVALLKPSIYKWKVDGSDGQGFIAHELQAIVPECVTGKKDAVDAEGNPVHQGIDTSFLVATLTAAIQEQQALITALTTRITALEGAAA
jgi:hypothetical protein